MVIYKYTLQIVDAQTISVPKGARGISAQIQNNQLQVWAIVDPDMPLVDVTFHIFGTGHRIDIPLPKINFISTVQHEGFVWHLFEEI